MTLTDAGPLIALIDAGEPDHERCTQALAQLALPLLTTWPAFTEAMYLLGRAGAWPGRLCHRHQLPVAGGESCGAGRALRGGHAAGGGAARR